MTTFREYLSESSFVDGETLKKAFTWLLNAPVTRINESRKNIYSLAWDGSGSDIKNHLQYSKGYVSKTVNREEVLVHKQYGKWQNGNIIASPTQIKNIVAAAGLVIIKPLTPQQAAKLVAAGLKKAQNTKKLYKYIAVGSASKLGALDLYFRVFAIGVDDAKYTKQYAELNKEFIPNLNSEIKSLGLLADDKVFGASLSVKEIDGSGSYRVNFEYSNTTGMVQPFTCKTR